MELFFLAIILAITVGSGAGIAYRTITLSKLRKSRIQKPQYDIEQDLTPAEFGYVLDGTIGRDELLGELLRLHNKGIIRFGRDASGTATIQKTLETTDKLPELDAVLLKNIFSGPLKPIPLKVALATAGRTIEYATQQSLQKKGWITTVRPHLTGTTQIPGKYLAALIGAIFLASLLSVVGGKLFNLSGEETYGLTIVLVLATCVGSIMFGLFIIARGAMLDQTKMAMHTTEQYAQRWHDVHSVYLYLRVSGNDIFTPNYQTLEVHKVDKLYPYAVAVGLDKKLYRNL